MHIQVFDNELQAGQAAATLIAALHSVPLAMTNRDVIARYPNLCHCEEALLSVIARRQSRRSNLLTP